MTESKQGSDNPSWSAQGDEAGNKGRAERHTPFVIEILFRWSVYASEGPWV